MEGEADVPLEHAFARGIHHRSRSLDGTSFDRLQGPRCVQGCRSLASCSATQMCTIQLLVSFLSGSLAEPHSCAAGEGEIRVGTRL